MIFSDDSVAETWNFAKDQSGSFSQNKKRVDGRNGFYSEVCEIVALDIQGKIREEGSLQTWTS